MHILKKISIGLMICISVPAAAEFERITRNYEVILEDFQMAATQNGALSFKECSTCEIQTIRVTNKTEYIINDEQIEQAEFRKAISSVRDRAKETIGVEHHLESDTVLSVYISL